MPQNKYKGSDLPDTVDWRWDGGQRYTTWSRNQHIPNYCGSCWSFAATSALSDRIMINYKDQFPEWDLAPQVLLDCDTDDDGCHGGDPDTAYQYILQNGIPSETCAPYQATGLDTGNVCNAEAICKNCSPQSCEAQPSYQLWYVTEHGQAVGEEEMMQALQDGPIVCGMAVTDQFEEYTGFSIYVDPSNITEEMHAISLVGYGTENGTPYWIGRNSWGTYWGYYGYFRIIRGVNNLGIEQHCSWATPADAPVWVNNTSELKTTESRHKTCRQCVNDWEAVGGAVITSPLPQDYIKDEDLPTSFSWANVNGTNFLTLARNQHIPQYCGSCWAFGTTSALSDRINILRASNNESIWPEINLAPQVLINEHGGGTCDGGDAAGVYHYIKTKGIPDETCQAYQAKNRPHGEETNLNICENCVPGNTSETFTPGVCYQMTNYTLYWVSEFGPVNGATNMQKEIYARGPISCGIDATSEFEAYTGGIYSQHLDVVRINHEISVVGWGVSDTGEAYWIGRNSWGVYWGENGFFRMEMNEDNLGIERDCTFGVPSWTKV